MKLFGLTGGIGMGKSTAAKLLAERGLPVLDTDTIAREIVAPGQPALAEITARFGPAILTPDGHLDRARLADLVFADSAARQQLEAILHPRIRAVWIQQTEIWRSEGRPTAIVVIPLLFETAAETSLDATVCIACSPATQHHRLRDRDWTADQIAARNRAQFPTGKKMSLATYVIWTEGPLAIHAAQLHRVIPGP
ncbi:dephospho-CoA kinase [Verrucomicrobiota bacterium]|nr:dephospho-CoA kinase [Verrucomicrobiota bacterium]